MLVALTDHIDRSSKNLLRGRRGYVHSWVLHASEAHKSKFVNGERILKQLPKVVFVKFFELVDGEEVEEEWVLPGLKEASQRNVVFR